MLWVHLIPRRLIELDVASGGHSDSIAAKVASDLQLRDSAGFSPGFPHYFEWLLPTQTRSKFHYTCWQVACQKLAQNQILIDRYRGFWVGIPTARG
jgi:hypothetical protein